MRTRSKLLDPITYPTTCRYRTGSSNPPTGTWEYPTFANGNRYRQDSQTMTDQKTPGYFRAVRENTVIPTSPMTTVKETYLFNPGQFWGVARNSSSRTYYRVEVDGNWNNPDTPWAAAPSAPVVDGAVALQEALSRAQSDAYDALTFAAEFRKTVEGIATLRSRAMTIWDRFESRVRSANSKKRYRANEVVNILTEIWLSMRYEWRPLVYDMLSAQEALGRLAAGIEDPLQRAYASRDASPALNTANSTSQTIGFTDSAKGSINGVTNASFRTTTVERSVHACVGLQCVTREIYFTDPFVTGWELVPYSFVLDWFVTIGDMLTAFSPFATGELRYATLATKTVTTRRSYNTMMWTSTMDNRTVEKQKGSEWIYITEKYERVNAEVKPTLAVDINLNVAKVVDLVSLWLTGNKKLTTRLLRYF